MSIIDSVRFQIAGGDATLVHHAGFGEHLHKVLSVDTLPDIPGSLGVETLSKREQFSPNGLWQLKR